MPNNSLNSLEWQGNSKKMYNAILNEVPGMFRGTVNSKITRWISSRNIRVVTEDTVFQAVRDIAPSNLQRRILPELEHYRSK